MDNSGNFSNWTDSKVNDQNWTLSLLNIKLNGPSTFARSPTLLNCPLLTSLKHPLESDPRDMGIQTQRIDTFIQADGVCIKVGCSLQSRDFFVILH